MNEVEGATEKSGLKTPASLRSFWLMFIVEFQNAFSDNTLKFLVTFFIIGMGLSQTTRDTLVPLVSAVFALPFVLFSMAGGFFADRFSKRNVAVAIKCAELGIMSVASLGLWLENVPLMLCAIFLMSTHSAFFGPTKYGMLPELLPQKKLSWGNGIFGLGTFAASISGQIFAGTLSDTFGKRQVWSGAILLCLALIGLSFSVGITRLPAADPQKTFRANFLGEFFSQLKRMRHDRVLFLGVLGNTFLWFLAALLNLVILFYGKDIMHLDDTHITYLLAALILGIGVGSLAAGYLSGGKIEYGLVPLGMVGLTVFAGVLSEIKPTPGLVALNLSLLGFFGGFYSVPVNAIIQHRPAADNKGGVIAVSALLSWIGILLASGVYYVFAVGLHLKSPQMFLAGALLSLAGAVYCVWLLPDSLLRFLLWCATHSFYRIRVVGRDNIPEKGGALFVCNHLSWVDAVLLIASTDRSVRFLMFKDIYEQKLIHPFARILGVIPISPEQRPREMLKSLQTASDAIRAGEVVCIFAEGQITRIGQLLPFRRGMERIMKNVDAPIVPVALDGVLGSPSSFKGGHFVWRLPSRIPHPVTVCFGKPLPPTATAFEARQAVQELLVGAWAYRRGRMRTLSRAFVRTCRKHPRRFAMADAQNQRVRFGAALVRTIFLARRLKKNWAGQEMVGVLLPPSVAGALTNFAALLLGKVPVNLNYTLSAEALASCAGQCHLKTVVTSRAFLEKVKLAVPGEAVFLEDAAAKPGLGEKLVALLAAIFLPASLLERTLGNGRRRPEESLTSPANGRNEPAHGGSGAEKRNRLDDLATVIFSSGSTGEPKGVMLSHYNISSNIEQMEQVFCLGGRDRILGILPFFHSFGFTGTLWLPAVLGVGVVFHPNPLDAKTIGPLVRAYAVTFLLATPTFLQIYLRGCAPGDFGSLRLVMTGAEKLPERLATAFDERFGIRPLEGYGCTECGPAVAVNAPDFRAAGFRQVGAKRGTIGHPLPGVSVRIVDAENPQSETPLPLGQPGLLFVHGPNVMRGYLGQPEKTAEVLRAGWYCTGDVAALDEDGFLQITDRLSRFSKIGGEMVPHLKVEEKLHELAGATGQTFVVSSVPDERKGERLVVLHKLGDADLAACLEKLAACDLPNLWKPRADQFFRVENFPLLGTGKLDLRRARELAAARSQPGVCA